MPLQNQLKHCFLTPKSNTLCAVAFYPKEVCYHFLPCHKQAKDKGTTNAI